MKPSPRLWLRAPVGGHSGPRGIQPAILAGGWGPFFARLTPIVEQAKPQGVIISNPWGESPGPMRIDAYAALCRDHPESPLTDATAFAEGVEDLGALCHVGVYLGGWAGPRASLTDLARAYDVGLDRLPRSCIPIVDAAGDALDFAGPLADTMASKGFVKWGIEPMPRRGVAAFTVPSLCVVTGEWFKRHMGLADREPLSRLTYPVLVQAESPFDTLTAVRAVVAGGCVPLVEAYRWREYASVTEAGER